MSREKTKGRRGEITIYEGEEHQANPNKDLVIHLPDGLALLPMCPAERWVESGVVFVGRDGRVVRSEGSVEDGGTSSDL